MREKLEEFFNTKGRRIAELRAKGGLELILLGISSKLTEKELAEYKKLCAQLEIIMWVFRPNDLIKRKKFNKEIEEYFNEIEKPYINAEMIKSNRKIKKSKA